MEKDKDYSKINVQLVKAAVQEKKKALDRAVSMMQNVIDNPEDYTSVTKDSVYANLVAELSCSIIAGDLKDLEETPRYRYTKDGSCYFIVDGVTFEVAQLMNMRKSKLPYHVDNDVTCTYDIAIPVCHHYNDLSSPDSVVTMHILDKDCWLYGATDDYFDEYKPVHTEFVHAAKAYIKEKGKEFLTTASISKEEDDE